MKRYIWGKNLQQSSQLSMWSETNKNSQYHVIYSPFSWGPHNAKGQEREKNIKIEIEEVKLSLFADNNNCIRRI